MLEDEEDDDELVEEEVSWGVADAVFKNDTSHMLCCPLNVIDSPVVVIVVAVPGIVVLLFAAGVGAAEEFPLSSIVSHNKTKSIVFSRN